MSNPFNWQDMMARAGLTDPFAPGTSVKQGRKAMRRLTPLVESDPPPMAEKRNLEIPGPDGEIPARIYVPEGAPENGPLCIYFHGGGYAFGDLESHDRVVQRLAAKSGCRFLAIEYRLAPEHPFPAAIDDALAAFDWAIGEGAQEIGADIKKLAVAGDSAGGGLAAVVAQARRHKLQFQLLIYPLLQLVETRKVKPRALEGHMLSVRALDWIKEVYCGDTSPMDVRISPLFEEELGGLPAALIMAAELDPLLDEGQAYRDRLEAAGVRVDYDFAEKFPHGYFNLTRVLPGAQSRLEAAARALGAALAK